MSYFSVDITVYFNGYHGDLNETFFVGNVDEKSKKLVKASWECLDLAIKEGAILILFNTAFRLQRLVVKN